MTNCDDDKNTIQIEKHHALNREIGSRIRDLRITAGIAQEIIEHSMQVTLQALIYLPENK